MPEHSEIPDSDLHEPKGAAGASANEVLQADGDGGSSFAKITSDNIDTTSIKNTNSFILYATIADISTASFIIVPVPVACTFDSAVSVLKGAIGTADADISFDRDDAASFGTDMTVAYSGSAEGDTDTFTATTNTSIAANGYVKIATDGASTNTIPLYLALSFTYA